MGIFSKARKYITRNDFRKKSISFMYKYNNIEEKILEIANTSDTFQVELISLQIDLLSIGFPNSQSELTINNKKLNSIRYKLKNINSIYLPSSKHWRSINDR